MLKQNLPIIEFIKFPHRPLDIYARFCHLPYSSFLDSALPSEKLGRFSFIGIEPFLIFQSKRDIIILKWMDRSQSLKGNPFLILKKLFRDFNINSQQFPVPFIGGGIGYFGYDLKSFNENLPDLSCDDIDMPDCVFCFYDLALVYDHFKKGYFIFSTGYPEKGRRRLYRAEARLENIKDKIFTLNKIKSHGYYKTRDNFQAEIVNLKSNFSKDSYVRAVKKAKEYIKSGDIYQVNLSQRFTASMRIEPFTLYRILRDINPAPFACYLNFGNAKVVSASPERFIKKENRHIQTRPIKGTRPRGKTAEDDSYMRKELVNSTKDRAENLMIIDLERNDLGRICEYGSVKVTEFMVCERYSTVYHLVSTIEGILREEVDAIECMINCFPGGSITGAPKIRSMEIIEELEPVKRGIYTGAIGYISFNGNMDTSIVIRTFLIKGKKIYFNVGGGIVYDSDPEAEYQETLDKAKALIDAIRLCALGKRGEQGIQTLSVVQQKNIGV